MTLEDYQRAHERAKAKVEFRIHLFTYFAVNTLLTIMNLIFSPGTLWVLGPVLGWGIGLIAHAAYTFRSSDKSYRERMVERELRKQNFNK